MDLTDEEKNARLNGFRFIVVCGNGRMGFRPMSGGEKGAVWKEKSLENCRAESAGNPHNIACWVTRPKGCGESTNLPPNSVR